MIYDHKVLKVGEKLNALQLVTNDLNYELNVLTVHFTTKKGLP